MTNAQSSLTQHILSQPRNYLALFIIVAGTATLITKSRQLKRLNAQKREQERRKDPGAKKKASQNYAKVDMVFLRRLMDIFKIMIPSWKSKEFSYLAGLTGLLVLRTYLSVIITKQLGKNGQALVTRNYKGLGLGVLWFGIITIPASAVNSALKYLQAMMALRFRMRLSHHVHKSYLDGVNFYRSTQLGQNGVRIDHADQRVTADIDNFCTKISELYSTIFKPVLDMILFTYKLVGITGFEGPLIMYSYFLLSGLLKNTVIPSLGKYVARESELEGMYRTTHKSLIVNSEEIAFYNGAETEKRIINSQLKQIEEHHALFSFVRALVSVADNVLVKYFASIAGYLTMIIPMMRNARGLGEKSVDEMTRDYILTSQYLGNLSGAVGEFVVMSSKVMKIAGYTHRVSELLEMVKKLKNQGVEPFEAREEANEPAPQDVAQTSGGARSNVNRAALDEWLEEWRTRCNDNRRERNKRHGNIPDRQVNGGGLIRYAEDLHFEHVDIVSPEGKILAKDLNMRVEALKNVMVTGPNGCGKSSLFRVISELWPLHCGVMTKPPSEELIFLPQKPYQSFGTLRDQITYPHTKKQMHARGVTDEDLKNLVSIVDPENTILSEWDLDDKKNWQQTMSLGIMQRIAAARLFYHRPLYCALDECTSCVSGETEDVIFETCKKLNITVFSVSHRPALVKHHDFQLHFEGREGKWEFSKIDHSREHETLCR
mmetsp:Transcript_7660/g.28701  ORF Transcript_7660/g.28701 Transcript_7660/m.28701 type:complete len:715 (-) Transcript_7660:99-2243(-)|eukprot:CAMPEP_0117450486 /NCGR_PEP_ID=MMETSP0759-20121206/8492_1 /TAXON_ID=63605 /ORGANISM="Percolomonas cosmopolitus, Strain WS" /LENGTH=714 /DNA_ID=CAMNT_0005243007 /DNA_START=156 /DNA_END=2300 /DNA_ORIENTATION=-